MNEEEQAEIASAPESLSAFLALWTRKEAALKLTGEGIRNDLKTVLTNAENIAFETKKTENCIYSIARYL
jgi:4'-phosphopantetheinyl transferase